MVYRPRQELFFRAQLFLCFRVFVADPQLVPQGSRQPRSTAKVREELRLQA